METSGLENFSPTPEKINTLPERLRRYIHELETQCDPSGEIRDRILAQETCQALEARIKELKMSLQGALAFEPKWVADPDRPTQAFWPSTLYVEALEDAIREALGPIEI